MNAVNLAPAGSNKRLRQSRDSSKPKVSLSPQSLALLGVLLVALVGTYVFVSAHDRVTSRRSQLSQIQNGVTAWTAAADGFSGSVAQSTQRESSIADVRQLIAERYHWSVLLTQMAGLLPADVQLSSLQASTPAATAAGGAGTADGVSVEGCATSQPAVAGAMVALRRVSGIANVTLSSSTNQDDSSSGVVGGDSGSSSSAVCSLPVQFQLTLVFAASSSSSGAGASLTAASTDSSTGVAQ